MMDREKVKNALERCLICDISVVATPEAQNAYRECEYTVGRYCGRKNVLRDALSLLENQEAVKPYVTGDGESFETAENWWYECGNCNKPIDPVDKFCRHCGRKVKWDDSN